MSLECPRRGRLFGCHFEGRYDLGPAQLNFESLRGEGVGAFLEKFRAKTYVRDVCTRCGRTVERMP